MGDGRTGVVRRKLFAVMDEEEKTLAAMLALVHTDAERCRATIGRLKRLDRYYQSLSFQLRSELARKLGA